MVGLVSKLAHLWVISVRYISESLGFLTFTLWSRFLQPSVAWG